MYTTFKEMPVWQKANSLAVKVHQITSKLPRSEDYGLTSQLRRAANSVSANIAEGFGRKTKKDKSNFYIIARGSAYETMSHLHYGCDVGYFESKVVEELSDLYSALIHELNKISNSLV